MMSRGQRLVLGIFVLLLVDIIWVGSSELTEYIFNDIGFSKPFFSTYLKISLFTLYLFGFIFWRPWRHQCMYPNHNLYQVVDLGSDEVETPTDDSNSLGESSYVPLKVGENEKSSDGDSDDASNKSVRFSKLTEVRQMSDAEAMEAMLSRLSFSASVRAQQLAQIAANKLQIREVIKISLLFSVIFFIGNYTYQLALSNTTAGVVNVVASTSGLFTLVLASIFPSSQYDKFSSGKFLAAILMIGGVVVISIEDIKLEGSTFPLGVIWSVIGAISYACYIVFLKRKVPNEEKMDFAMFFGFVGLFNVVIMWPGFVILHLIGWETLQIPTKQQFLFMLLNGIIGTVLSELLWLWGCFLTSSLLATLSLSLTIPLTMAVDVWIKGVKYPWLLYVGMIPMMLSFIMASLLTHYENSCDSIKNFLQTSCGLCSKRRHLYSQVNVDSTEEESLIVDDTNIDHSEEEGQAFDNNCSDEDDHGTNSVASFSRN